MQPSAVSLQRGLSLSDTVEQLVSSSDTVQPSAVSLKRGLSLSALMSVASKKHMTVFAAISSDANRDAVWPTGFAIDAVRKLSPMLQLLPDNTTKSIPVKCNICKRKNKKPVIFDLCSATQPYKLEAHLSRKGHIDGLEAMKQAQPSTDNVSSEPEQLRSSSESGQL